MTEKQAEKIKLKIKKIKSELSADKRRWGGFYDDSRGLRYLAPQYYIKLQDWSGGLRYLNWFHKNFPDDGGFPDFLFELAIILLKSGKTKQAEQMIFRSFCSNTYIIDKFFDKALIPIEKYENSNIDIPEYLVDFKYRSYDANLSDFSQWLKEFVNSEKFKNASQKIIEIQKLLKKEEDRELRGILLNQLRELKKEF